MRQSLPISGHRGHGVKHLFELCGLKPKKASTFMLKHWVAAVSGILLWVEVNGFAAEDRDAKVRNDRDAFQQNEAWLYNDLNEGFVMAKSTGKPLLVIFRCIP
jgi:hypothetical protein